MEEKFFNPDLVPERSDVARENMILFYKDRHDLDIRALLDRLDVNPTYGNRLVVSEFIHDVVGRRLQEIINQ